MSRVLRIELRRSAALGALIVFLVAGATMLYVAPQRWAHGWLALAMTQREYLLLVWPLALAAGAWQGRREHRYKVNELFTTAPRPQYERMVPTLGAMGIAAACAYVAVTAVGVPWIIGTARYLPGTVFVVAVVGVLALVAGVWLGLAVGRLLPHLVTAPALTVAGVGLLMVLTSVSAHRPWLGLVFSPMYGMHPLSDYGTVSGRASAAQTVWLVALAGTAVALLASGTWRTRLAAVMPAGLGAALALTIVPHSEFADAPIDAAAQEQVCADGTPTVCVSRIHAGLLPEVTPIARQALALLAKLPDPPTTVHEDTTTYYPDPSFPPREANVVLVPIRTDARGHLAAKDTLLPKMLYAAGANMYGCPDGSSVGWADAHAAGYWLLGRETDVDAADSDPETVALWHSLQKLPAKEAAARVAALRRAALACQPVAGILRRSAQ
jgi:hypothetical protein